MPINTASTPIEWAQRKNVIYVNVRAEDLADPVIKIEEDKLYLKGTSSTDKKVHEVSLDLFGKVIPDESKYMVRGRGAEIVMQKADQEGPYWKRLFKDDKRYHWLKVDFNKWKDEDESDEEIDLGGPGGGFGGPGGGGGGMFEDMMRQMGGIGGPGAGLGGPGDLDGFDDDEEDPSGSDSDDDQLPDLVDASPNPPDANASK